MDRAPTSIADFYKAVLFARHNHAELLDVDHIILLAMASFADAHTGQNTFIGIENLCKITRRKERAIRYRLRCLEAAKLIQCTADAKGGRGHAAVYRLCLEHPAYQPFVPKGGNLHCPLCGKKGCNQDCPLSDPIPPVTLQPTDVKAATEPVKGATDRVKGATRIAPHPLPSEPTSTPPSKPDTEGWLSTKTAIMGVPTKKERHELEKLVGDHGLPVVQEVARQFENRDKGLAGLKHPWLMLLQEAPTLIPAAKEAVWKASAEYKAQQDLFCIQLSILVDTWHTLPPVNWPHMTEEELALLQKAKAGDPQRLFLSREELKDLRAIKNRYSDWQREQEKKEREDPVEFLNSLN